MFILIFITICKISLITQLIFYNLISFCIAKNSIIFKKILFNKYFISESEKYKFLIIINKLDHNHEQIKN